MGNDPLPSLITLMNHQMAQIAKYHFLSCLHNMATLKKGSIGLGEDQKQFSCCPYCGVRGENQDSAYSHARRHLNYELLCESCLTFHTFSTGNMMRHIKVCEAAAALRSGPLGNLNTTSTKGGAVKAEPKDSSLKNIRRVRKGKKSSK